MSIARTKFALPPFYCPVDPAVHPQVDAIEKRAISWIDELGMYEDEKRRRHVLKTNSAEFFSRFAPNGTDENVLLAAKWVYWGFAFDDVRCDEGPLSDNPGAFVQMAGRVQRVLEAPQSLDAPEDPYLRALHDFGLSLRRQATPTQVRRFIDAHRAWLHGVAWQIGNQAHGIMPPLNDYLAMRLGSCGGFPTMALLEIANEAEVPAAEMDHPAVRAASEAAVLTAGLDNDLHSYRREQRDRHADQNIITVLTHHEGISVDEALTSAVGLRDRIMHVFLRLNEQLLPDASSELRTYLTCLAAGIRGNIDWALRVPRYTTEHEPAVDEHPGFSAVPSNPDPVAPPIPTIAWWWHELRS
ncbi:terpene synthase family protein [Saccharopolyspora mangrovi]|uniref:Terpene synthase n=1 Tax=Saccharopolyspora mangrovi TaxID=3082379 RepID=A0ABU6A533_9PSEU|nr:terpene synthase family protein [Saccharopolyspora sp. S2-29]MEB3366687.1 terpene synthase family protein [Saccharopolyspora sp. S2-29]